VTGLEPFSTTRCAGEGVQPNRKLDKQPSHNRMVPPTIPTFRNSGNIGAK